MYEQGVIVRFAVIAEAPKMVAEMKRMGRPVSHGVRSTYTDVRPQERLVLTSLIDFIPGVTPYESDKSVDFSVSGGIVMMVILLDQMHNDEFTKMTAGVWP